MASVRKITPGKDGSAQQKTRRLSGLVAAVQRAEKVSAHFAKGERAADGGTSALAVRSVLGSGLDAMSDSIQVDTSLSTGSILEILELFPVLCIDTIQRVDRIGGRDEHNSKGNSDDFQRQL